MSRGDLHEALIEKAAKAINPYLGCCLDCPDADHAARTVADDIRAEALADLAAAHPVPALTRAMNHARRAEDHWAADTVASLVDALTRCTRPHPTASEPPNGRLHHNHTTRGIKQRGECPACDHVRTKIKAAAWDEGHADGQHNEHEHGRKITNTYREDSHD